MLNAVCLFFAHQKHEFKVEADAETREDAQTLMECMLHGIDIGHPTYSWEEECRWARLVATEFQAQVRLCTSALILPCARACEIPEHRVGIPGLLPCRASRLTVKRRCLCLLLTSCGALVNKTWARGKSDFSSFLSYRISKSWRSTFRSSTHPQTRSPSTKITSNA